MCNVECTVTLTVDFEVRHNIVTKKWNGLIVGFSQFGINIVNTNTVAFDASCKFELEYQNETPDFCVHPKTGIIHSSDCRYIVNSSIMTIYEKYSTQQLLHTYNVDSVKKLASKECTVCKPISGLEGGLFIVNASTKKVHCADCVHVAKIDKAEYWVILPFAGEYSYCTDCMPDKAQHKEFNECFKNSINSEDLTEVMKKVKEYTAGLARGEKKSPGRRLATLRFDAPIVSLLVDIDFVLDLDLEISLDLHMEKTFVNDVYVRLVGNKIECGSNPDKDNKGTLKDSVDAMGSMEFKVGIRLGARVTFNGPFEKWCYIGISVEGGVYVDIRGIFHATRTDGELNDDYYYAAYFECGIYLNAYFDYALFVFEDSIPLGDKKFPIWVGGNDRIYYQYSDYDKTVDITRDATSLSSLDLLQVDYMLLNEAFTKKSGVLSPSGVSNQYTVSYAFKNEDGSANTYCVVENGTLKIKKGAPEDFTVIMIVTVTGKKAATFQDFLSMSYTEGNRKPVFFLEPYEITLVVDRDSVTGGDEESTELEEPTQEPETEPEEPIEPESPVYSKGLAFTSNGDGTCSVSGIGTCTDTELNIPPVSPAGDSVTRIGSDAFNNCTSLTAITIPDGVTSIGHGVFVGCYDLTSIKVGEGNPVYHSSGNCLIEMASKTLIAGCMNSVIPADGSVTSIGDSAFAYCYNLTSITIPDGVTSIGDSAFADCYDLTSITIPDGVTSIGDFAFAYCYDLTSITIPDGVTSIGDSAFYECVSLTSITIPDGVTSIGDCAFYWCESLTSITIPDGVTSIGDYAFYWCESLTSITIPDGVTSIGDYAFEGCYNLTSIKVGEGNPVYHSSGNCLIETASKTLIAGCMNSVIPADGSVTSIGDSAFAYCYNLTSITIPDGVTSIGDFAFAYCYDLTSITIPDGVTSIGGSAFDGCEQLIQEDAGVYYVDRWVIDCDGDVTNVVLRSNTVGIGESAFEDCESLTSITIPVGVTSIGRYAFYKCTFLTSITIPDSVTSIGDYAFCWCESLTSITIPDGVTSIGGFAFDCCEQLIQEDAGVYYVDRWVIDCDGDVTNVVLRSNTVGIGDWAFAYCYDLTSIIIPDGVTSIGDYAFYWCESLTSITIPDGVTSFGWEAFFGCESLTDVYYNGTAEQWEAIKDGGNNDDLFDSTIHCADGDILSES